MAQKRCLLALENLEEQLAGVDDRAGLAREQFGADHRALEAQLLRLGREIDALDSQQREQRGRVQRNAESP